ncbi:MAG TPA: transposase [Eubacterium sp.]|nr:transposase [Eubacterium sp.]
MRLVYKFNNYQNNDELFRLCRISKDLYNQALYVIKTNLKNENRFTFYSELDKILKDTPNLDGEINYRKLKAQVSQQCIKVLDKSIKGYVKSIKDWSKHKENYKGKPNLPNYKAKNGYNQLIYTNQCSSIKDGKIFFSKDLCISIPQWEKYKDKLTGFHQIRVNPKYGYTEIEIIYEYQEYSEYVDQNRFSSIDLGLGNLVSMVTDFSEPIIYSGAQIKSKNQFFNKRISFLKSITDTNNKKISTKQIKSLWDKRNKQLNDVFHKISRHIVNILIQNNVGNLIIGHNNGWKDSINIGKVNNQNFVMIPFDKLISYLKYKCEMSGIMVIETEESYTSKCDALALEIIHKHDKYKGKRVKRGMFQSSIGKLINADVNGALNIMRKVVGDSYVCKIIDSGLLFRPIKFNDLYSLKIVKVYE